MGLAASQARLLSITSRMSDNELRSQLINNAKMRLTADTSKVSDEYIDALNKTQLMFTNFDLKGNEVYQDLTFNTLMAYSAYNTQYGIVNNAGQIVVSAGDAGNFEAAGGDIEKFLESYGLKKTTDYFEKMIASEEFNEKGGIGYYDSYGVWQPIKVDAADLQAIYEGEVDSKGISHYGISENKYAVEYGDYYTLADEYGQARDNYKDKLLQRMSEWWAGKADLSPNGAGTYSNGDGTVKDTGVFRVTNNKKEIFRKYDDFESYYGWAMKFSEAFANGTWNEIKDEIPSTDMSWYVNILKCFGHLVGFTDSFDVNQGATPPNDLLIDCTGSNKVNQPLVDILKTNMDIINTPVGTLRDSYAYSSSGASYYVETDSDGNQRLVPVSQITIGSDPSDGGTLQEIAGWPNRQGYIPATTGKTVYYLEQRPGCTYTPAYVNKTHNPPIYGFQGDGADFDNDPDTSHSDWELDTGNEILIKSQEEVTEAQQGNALAYLWSAFRDSVMNNISADEFINNDTEVKKARKQYIEAAINLANFIYGEANGASIVGQMVKEAPYNGIYGDTDLLEQLDDPSWVLSTNSNLSEDYPIGGYQFDVDWDYKKSSEEVDGVLVETDVEDTELDPIRKSHTNPFIDMETTLSPAEGEDPTLLTITYNTYDDNGNITNSYTRDYNSGYQPIKDEFILQCMLEHYGEPKYTWIDQNNKDEDGTAKATWYMNLFNRMQQGYTTIDKNVTNSQEWLQFAFESSLVHMEQVNKSSEWVPLMYSNCASITESTADVDITVAEAKYKREMAKIEAKDKQYDIELKNIDTEHESLKQEYESIKTVIDKNIERNMKLFVQG